MPHLNGKVALVTGASYGIGRAISIGLAREGADLVLVARSQGKLQETKDRALAEGVKVHVCPTDLRNASSVTGLGQFIQENVPQIDFLVHCAFGHIGEDQGKSILDVTMDELAEFAQTSVVGTWWLTREILPALKRATGHAVFIVADWGFPQHNVLLSTRPDSPVRLGSEVFVSAKYAISGLANSLERMSGVRVSAIYPGIVASLKPSSLEAGQEQYFDIDDDLEAIEAESPYSDGGAIPLIDVVESAIFALTRRCGVRSILLKPRNTNYDGLGV